MNKNVYENTRYQNIYRHKKNKNYIIMISKPVKSSISKIDGQKILSLDDALRIRDNPKIRLQKGAEITCKSDFDTLWCKYIEHCKYEQKLAYNTIIRKEKTYNRYFKNKITKKVPKITKNDLALFIDQMVCSDKQKNQAIKELKTFFNYLIREELIINSPISNIKNYKVEKTEMKYWIPEQLKTILSVLDKDIECDNLKLKEVAYRTKILILINFSLGDRIGETRALTFDCFDKEIGIVKIKHSINYDTKSSNFLSNTKNYHSQRDIEITNKLIDEINNYKSFLINEMDYHANDNSIIFFNYSTNRPFNDTTLRKSFYNYCKKANVPKIRMYDLRHTYVATMMMEGKELYHISERLGHSSYSTTVNKYGHLSNQVRKEIAEITDKYI